LSDRWILYAEVDDEEVVAHSVDHLHGVRVPPAPHADTGMFYSHQNGTIFFTQRLTSIFSRHPSSYAAAAKPRRWGWNQ